MSDIPKEALGCVTEMDEAARKAEFDAFFKTLPEATQILRSTVPEDSETWRRAQIIGNEAPELAPYRDEPIQFKSAGVGKNGFLRLKMRRDTDGRTIMVDMERRTPFIILKARCWDEAMPNMRCLYTITTGGGVLQGDRYAVDLLIEEGAEAHISTQTATKIQAMDANYAVQTQTIKVEDNAYFEYMPDLTIPCEHSRYLTDTRIEMGKTPPCSTAKSWFRGGFTTNRKNISDSTCFLPVLGVTISKEVKHFVRNSFSSPNAETFSSWV